MLSCVWAAVRRNFSTLTHSYVHGVSTTPLVYKTVVDVLEDQVERNVDKTAFIFPHQSIRKSYGEFYEDVKILASGFVGMGLKIGDRIGIWAPNVYDWVVTQFASSMTGLVFVTVNPAYEADELEYCLDKVQIKCLIAANNLRGRDSCEILRKILPNLSSSGDELNFPNKPYLRRLVFMDKKPYAGALTLENVKRSARQVSRDELNVLKNMIQSDDPANIQFTSGTTGRPKGATLTHFNIINNAKFTGQRLGYDSESIICCCPPLYHCFGCVIGSLCSVIYGATCVFPSVSFSAKESMKYIEKERCTSVYGTPTMFIDMLSHPNFSKHDFSSLKTGIMAGATCPAELCSTVIKDMNVKHLTILYGTTENSPSTFQSTMFSDHDERIGTVGRVHDHIEAKIVDDYGKILPINTPGELMIRGYCVMLNYWDDDEKTNEVLSRDKWYKTGDMAVLDEHGRLKIVGRKRDMIIRGGENVYPAEIEEFLHRHPKVADAQVVGVPDKRLGEEVCVWVRLKDGRQCSAEEIREFCKGKVNLYAYDVNED